jgi:gamma-glutamyltranspeptidase/glutathione hydrolase
LSRNKKNIAALTAIFLSWIFASLFLLSSCRSQEILEAPPAADRHIPHDYVGQRAMVVAAQPLAVEAGIEMLKSGGNAVDAAIATALALNAAEPFASGIGGGGFMVIYLARAKKTTVINFREKAPQGAGPLMFKEKGEAENEWRTTSGLAVAVPGALAGWNLALSKYGMRSLAQAAARAIEIAEQGFPVSKTFSEIDKEEYERLIKNAGEGTCYLREGLPYEPGDTFRNPDLARTLKLIASKGVDEFYRGGLARKIVAAVAAKQGIMTLDDLASYKAVEVKPLTGTYKDFTIVTVPPPASGGLHLLQLLNIVENWPVRSWGQNSAAFIHHLSEAFRFIFADRERYLGDPDYADIPVPRLLAKDYAEAVASRIIPDRPLGRYPYGIFEGKKAKSSNTTHLCVMDKEGNVVALTQSINDFFGSGIVPDGAGFLLNDHMDDFSSDPQSLNAPGPGRRPVSSMAPLIIFKKGRPFLVLGSPGGPRIFPSLSEIILNVTEFGMSLDEAIEAPRFFSSSSKGKPDPIFVESRISQAAVGELRNMGHEVEVKLAYDKYFGGAQGIMVVRGKSVILGAADSRRDGAGAGY